MVYIQTWDLWLNCWTEDEIAKAFEDKTRNQRDFYKIMLAELRDKYEVK